MNLAFQFAAGSQTSILISESDVGLSVAATRQKAGRRLKSCCCGGGVPGARLNSAAGARAARGKEVAGRERVARESQVAAASGAARVTRRMSVEFMIRSISCGRNSRIQEFEEWRLGLVVMYVRGAFMDETRDATSRRGFLKASALAGMTPFVQAAENNTIQLALVGCGGRGTGATENAFGIKNGPIKLVAMADVFPQKLSDSHGRLRGRFPSQMDVPLERQFIGFDGYRKAMDALNPGDVVILATPPAFRWVHFRYAIDKGLNVFMEKPISVDGPTTRRMIALGEEAGRKNLKVGEGLMVRHCRARQELLNRVPDVQVGD